MCREDTNIGMTMDEVEWERADLFDTRNGNVVQSFLLARLQQVIVDLTSRLAREAIESRRSQTLPVHRTRRLTSGFGAVSKIALSDSLMNRCKPRLRPLIQIAQHPTLKREPVAMSSSVDFASGWRSRLFGVVITSCSHYEQRERQNEEVRRPAFGTGDGSGV